MFLGLARGSFPWLFKKQHHQGLHEVVPIPAAKEQEAEKRQTLSQEPAGLPLRGLGS